MYDYFEYDTKKHNRSFIRIFFKLLFCFFVIFIVLTFFVTKYNIENVVLVQKVSTSDLSTSNSESSNNSESNSHDSKSDTVTTPDDVATPDTVATPDAVTTPDDVTTPETSPNNDMVVQSPSVQNSTQLSETQYDNIIHIYRNSPQKTVYLTFDDGPSANITPLILDLLNNENIKATFFVLGNNVARYPEIVKREYEEGHYIANHGYSHKYSEIYQSADTILNDYLQCEQCLKTALNNENFSSKVYRFPGGSSGGKYNDIKLSGKETLKQNNVAYLDWNALTCDAEGTPTHESILQNLQQTVGNKDVVVLLMHDSSSKILTYETLPEVISFFRDKGYNFKNLYDTLAMENN